MKYTKEQDLKATLLEEDLLVEANETGTLSKETYDELVSNQIKMEHSLLIQRQILQNLWVDSKLSSVPRYPKSLYGACDVSVNIESNVLWITVPPLLSRKANSKQNKRVYFEDAIVEKLHELRDSEDKQRLEIFLKTLEEKFVVVIEFIQSQNTTRLPRDVDNTECGSVINAVVIEGLTLSDNASRMSLYKCAKKGHGTGTRIGVMSKSEFVKYLQNEA